MAWLWASLGGGLAVFLLDQASKYVLAWVNTPLVLGHVQLGIFPNAAGAFGVSWPVPLLLAGAVAVLTVLVYLGITQQRASARMAAAVAVAGGMSNLFDRLMFGFVRDVAAVDSLTFNLADIAIVTGILWLLAMIWRRQVVDSNAS